MNLDLLFFDSALYTFKAIILSKILTILSTKAISIKKIK